MTLDKAIEILDLNIKEAGKKMPPDVNAALGLGIQALKRWEIHRNECPGCFRELLPGETKE